MTAIQFELVCAGVLVVGLTVLAIFFGRIQLQTLKSLRRPEKENLANEDKRYCRTQAWRRLWCCGLMVVMAGLLGAWYLFGMHDGAVALGQHETPAGQEAPLPGPRDTISANLYISYWIIVTLVLFIMVVLAFMDFWAIRRFGLRQLRKIRADQQIMMERQAAILRSQRNGEG